jgi:hypothetical protein
MLCLHYTLCLIQLSVVHNLILVGFSDWFTMGGLLVIDVVGWRSMYLVVMPRVNLIVILSTYARYLYFINCPTIICLPSMCYFILWRDTTSVLWTPVRFRLYCYHLFTLLALFTIAFHSIRSYTLFTANRWDWQPHRKLGAKYLVVLCAGSMLPLAKQSLDEAPYKLSEAVAKLASITFLSLAFSWIQHTLVSYWGKTRCYTHQTFLLGFPTGRWFSLSHTATTVALLNLKVSYAFMFCSLVKDKLKTICYVFPYDLNTHLTFIVSFSWFFICVLFHVITWSLSFFYQDYIFRAHVLSSFDPSTQFFT